jgi:hypothetical protein
MNYCLLFLSNNRHTNKNENMKLLYFIVIHIQNKYLTQWQKQNSALF